ncbi:elongation factor P (EF-P) KOW-like domain-containing protein [Dunaliella salina]|uniref:Elongation factor P (EF-P) KOW-like domain-containing protein n=1 Tax=Dunaliella salina TaxID=3046 RepID=A0ABQ7GUP5_DUNSA|nr:elongation factor P (EF-P) KOW-like domain-containing protein [Dunaliella salina]|eukprot:KAF5838265.1 elongation factor P (EF-P) KOW-like domain-containing protein [Dunaliella salina]
MLASRLQPMNSVRTSSPALQSQRPPVVVAPYRLAQPLRRAGIVTNAGGTISPNDFKNGLNLEIDGAPYKVVEFLHVKPGKGAAFVRSKLRNQLTGGVVEKTFRSNESLTQPDLMRREAQFTYADGDEYVFMDQETYEETRVKRDDWAEFLLEGATCQLLFYNGKVISVDPPTFVDLEIIECPPNVKGNTASGGGTKAATLSTGAVVQVPAFLDAGTRVKVDTRTGTYLSKIN